MAITLFDIGEGDIILIDNTVLLCIQGADPDGDLVLENMTDSEITVLDRVLDPHDWLYFNIASIQSNAQRVAFIGNIDMFLNAIIRCADKFPKML